MSHVAARKQRGFSVRVFLPDGDPDGIKLVEKSNWTGCGLVVPRSLFAESRSRLELSRAGIYVLVGSDTNSPLQRVYVGEGDPVKPRLEQHAKHKDFWTHVVVFTSKDQNLNKAHVQYLESRLVSLASASKRCVLDNANTPLAPSLSEADIAEIEGFLDDVLLCLPVLGYGFFIQAAPPSERPATTLQLNVKGIRARGYESAQGFVVLAGSLAAKNESEAIHGYLSEIRKELLRQGVFSGSGETFTFTQDYVFGSPSTASGVILGRTSNGRVEWKNEEGVSLKQLQDEDSAS